MTCPRCDGLMVREWLALRDAHFARYLLRCLLCGCRLDWRIHKHQQEARALAEARRHWKEILWEEVKDLVAVAR